ncbi:MAG: GNAT family N-acetyltransferase [Bacteroidetes bacterium]|nr:GNAT family N-acetyltransferase [Bacteroidota bacterium]
MKHNLILRKIQSEDCIPISEAFNDQGWNKPVAQYKRYVEFQQEGSRDIIIAELNGEFAGYLTIKWESDYIPFREKAIPEIVDFNVLKKFQRKGIGTALMDEAEKRIKQVSDYAGIGFGVYKDYGAAQVLYIRRNYVPDGNGLVKDSRSLEYGEMVEVNDDLVICLVKEL